MAIKGSKKGWSAKRFQGAKTKVDRIHDFKEEKLRFACMRTQKKKKWCCGADETLLFVPSEPPFAELAESRIARTKRSVSPA